VIAVRSTAVAASSVPMTVNRFHPTAAPHSGSSEIRHSMIVVDSVR